jgi:hypothetical protein
VSEAIATQELAFEARFVRALRSVGLSANEEDPTEIVETVEPHQEIEKKAAEPRAATPINLFQHPDAHPIALDLALLRRYGPLWLTWEPETLELRVPVDFHTQSLSSLNLDKLMAVKTLHLGDEFWKRWEIFSACTNPLNDVFAEFEVMQVPTYAEVIVAADIARQIRTDVTWSEELETYIRTVMEHDGVLVGIEPLEKIRPFTSGLNSGLIEEAWPAVRQTGCAPAGDTAEDEQLRRMLTVEQYLEQNRQRLREQLPLVLKS